MVALIVTDEIAENQRYLFHPRARKEDRRRERKTRTTEREGCGFSGNVGQVSEVRLFPVHPGNGRWTRTSFCSCSTSVREQSWRTWQNKRPALPLAFRKAVRSKREREGGEGGGLRRRRVAVADPLVRKHPRRRRIGVKDDTCRSRPRRKLRYVFFAASSSACCAYSLLPSPSFGDGFISAHRHLGNYYVSHINTLLSYL